MGSSDTYRCCTCGGTLCSVAVPCYDEFWPTGYLWVSNSCTVAAALLWVYSGLFWVVLDLTFV